MNVSAHSAGTESIAASPSAGTEEYAGGLEDWRPRPALWPAAGAFAPPALTLGVAGLLCLIAFYARGGPDPVNPGPMTTLEMALTLGGGLVVAGVVALTPAARITYGLWPAGLLLAFAALC